jgi:flagellar biosynthesis/type III secretory pathway protein FliH
MSASNLCIEGWKEKREEERKEGKEEERKEGREEGWRDCAVDFRVL